MNKFVLGLDIGYNGLKITQGFSGKFPYTSKHIPSGAGLLDKMPALLSLNGETKKRTPIFIDDVEWVAGVNTDDLELPARQLDSDFPASDEYKALFYFALAGTGQKVIDRLVTGLPVSQYFNNHAKQNLVDLMTGVHQINPSLRVEVKEVIVLPQPAGAFFDALFHANEDVSEAMSHGKCVVFDPGFYSVDWVAFQEQKLKKSTSGTSLKATSVVYQEAAGLINKKYGDGTVTVSAIEKMIAKKRDSFLIGIEKVPLQPFFDQASAPVAKDAITALKEQMRQETTIPNVVILAGGGAPFFKKALCDTFPRSHILTPDDAVMSISRGYWLYGA